MGLNWDSTFFIVKQGRLVLNHFFYCLIQPEGPQMYDKSRSDQFKIIPFVTHPNSYTYGLNLLDIIIAGKRLNLSPNSCTIKPDGQGGCVIDSRSVPTIIEYEVYIVLI